NSGRSTQARSPTRAVLPLVRLGRRRILALAFWVARARSRCRRRAICRSSFAHPRSASSRRLSVAEPDDFFCCTGGFFFARRACAGCSDGLAPDLDRLLAMGPSLLPKEIPQSQP